MPIVNKLYVVNVQSNGTLELDVAERIVPGAADECGCTAITWIEVLEQFDQELER